VVAATATVVPPAIHPATPNTDPPQELIMIEQNPDGTLDGFFNGLGYETGGGSPTFDILYDAGKLQTTATAGSCMESGHTTVGHAGATPLYSAGFNFRKVTGLQYGENPYAPSAQGIPDGATITGFTVKFWRAYNGAAPSYAHDLQVLLRVADWTNVISGTGFTYHDSTDLADTATHWPEIGAGSNYLTVYGGPTNLWGFTAGQITPEMVNTGVMVRFQHEVLANGGTAGDLWLYGVFLEVTYEV
jgi:hypothetical protein